MPKFAIIGFCAIENEYNISIVQFPNIQHYIKKCLEELGNNEEEFVVEQQKNGWVKVGIDFGEEFWEYIKEVNNEELLNKNPNELKTIVME